MRAAVRVVVVLALLVVAGGVVASPELVSGPRLTVGDFWTYHTNTSLGGDFYLEGQVTVAVQSQGPATVGGASTDVVVMSATGNGDAAGTFSTPLGSTPASGRWLVTGEETLESAGLKVVSSVLDLEANGTFHTQPVPIPFQLTIQNTTTFRFFEDQWRYPIALGNSTVVTARMNFSEDFRLFYGIQTQTHANGSAWWNTTYDLEAAIAIDTPAGHFDAYRIRETAPDGTYAVRYYAPGAGNDARTETYNGTTRVATSDLLAYRYQALEPARFFGLTFDQWAILVGVAAAGSATGAWILVRRRSRPPDTTRPPT